MSARTALVPVSARTPLLDGKVAADEALRIILAETLAQIGANVPVVVEARHSEGLHQLRVGLRRLRTALKLADMPALAALDGRAKTMVAAVGPARDLDVFVADLFQPAVNALGARRGFDLLAGRAERLRAKAWHDAIAAVSHEAFLRFTADVAETARGLRWNSAAIEEAAPALLDHALKRALKRGRHFKRLDPPSRHHLRIALKKLRYACEFFAPLYARKDVKLWLSPLKELQDLLGDLNDVAQVRSVVASLLQEEAENAAAEADLNQAAGLLQGFHQQRGEAVAEKTARRWKAFRDAEPFWV